jgi:hypothetical protein
MLRILMVAALFALSAECTLADTNSAQLNIGLRIVKKGDVAPSRQILKNRKHSWGSAMINLSKAGHSNIQKYTEQNGQYLFVSTVNGSTANVAVSVLSGQIVVADLY